MKEIKIHSSTKKGLKKSHLNGNEKTIKVPRANNIARLVSPIKKGISSQASISEVLTGAAYILKKLSLIGIKNIFGIPGAHIDPLITASVNSDIDTIINCHELSAGYMADGYARTSHKLGVITCIGGPGSNNMVTAINMARIEKVPLLLISGDVPSQFSDVPGFQCANEFGTNDDAIFKPITKFSKRIEDIDDLVQSLDKAIEIALTPPFGPSHIIMPYNVFLETTSAYPETLDFDELKYWKNEQSSQTISRIKELIVSDKKIIFWIGNSLNRTNQAKHIKALAEKFHIPVASSYSAKGVFPEDHNLALGNFGFAGSNLSKKIFLSHELDVIIGFDIEQNERNSLNWNSDLYQGKELISINFPGSYSNKKYGESIEDNPFYILRLLYATLMHEKYDMSLRVDWFKEMKQRFNTKTTPLPISNNGTLEPGRLIQIMQKEIPEEAILFVDSGNHRVFPGFYWKAPLPQSYYSGSIIAPLGWALAAGIGCKFGRKEPVVVFTGDGCMQMHGIELKTAIKYKKPILVVLNNNKAFGSIYRRLAKISEEATEMADITEINWNMFGKSFGAEVFDIHTEANFIKHIRVFLADQKLTILNVSTPVAPFIHDISLAKSAFA
jgi:acetolactate synthase-1/2/3 large subunit